MDASSADDPRAITLDFDATGRSPNVGTVVRVPPAKAVIAPPIRLTGCGARGGSAGSHYAHDVKMPDPRTTLSTLRRRSKSLAHRLVDDRSAEAPRTNGPVAETEGLGPAERMRLKNRSNYKETWTALAQTTDDAANAVAGYVDEAELDVTARHTVDVLREYIGINPTDDILEIGCGIGRVGKVLAPQCASWTGADISAGMIEIARRRTSELPNVRFEELFSVGLSGLDDDSFDVVYCTVVFMHLFEWDRFTYVKEAVRVLRPGGRCFFDNVDITSDHGKQFFALSASHPIDARPPHIGMVSSGDELRSYGEWAGLADIQIHRWDNAWVALTGSKQN